MIRAFSANAVGRDYICSDIHGHFSLLMRQLNAVDFDEKVDRLFSLGDLIDRGDESDQALEWLAKPWFFAIQGNHERMLIDVVESDSESYWQQWVRWGGQWAQEMGREALEPFHRTLSALPIAIELSLPGGKTVGLVHAELPDVCDWLDVKQLLRDTDPAEAESNHMVSQMLWSKMQPYLPAEEIPRVEPVANVDHVFHGHTIVADYLTITNRTFMDLGSYESGKIGLLEPARFVREYDLIG